MRASVLSDWLAQRLDRGNGQPIYRQLHRLLQQAILTRELPPGSKVPSSRLLAQELGIGRNTVTQVYEQLVLEGYVSSATGRGTFVADSAPDEIVGVPDAAAPDTSAESSPQQAKRALSTRGARLIAGAGVSKRQWGAFMPGVPDVTKFPARVWSRLHNKYWRRLRPDLLTYAPGGGLASLRHALADYLRTSRSVRCTPEQIIITTGIHQSVDLAVRLLSDPGDVIWTEDPCYWGVRSVLHVSGLQSRPIAVDEEGINPSADDLAQPPKLMLVTPSHQYPLGMVMSLARRRMLLEYARQNQCWIIEDDYDSEFRYDGAPIPSLQGLDTDGRVIYMGTFSKTLFAGLRMSYMVVPGHVAHAFSNACARIYRPGHLHLQAALADFMADGHFSHNIKRMRVEYAERQGVLREALHAKAGDLMTLSEARAGLHVYARLAPRVPAARLAEAARAEGLVLGMPHFLPDHDGRDRNAVVLGYGGVPTAHIADGVDRLARALARVAESKR